MAVLCEITKVGDACEADLQDCIAVVPHMHELFFFFCASLVVVVKIGRGGHGAVPLVLISQDIW